MNQINNLIKNKFKLHSKIFWVLVGILIIIFLISILIIEKRFTRAITKTIHIATQHIQTNFQEDDKEALRDLKEQDDRIKATFNDYDKSMQYQEKQAKSWMQDQFCHKYQDMIKQKTAIDQNKSHYKELSVTEQAMINDDIKMNKLLEQQISEAIANQEFNAKACQEQNT